MTAYAAQETGERLAKAAIATARAVPMEVVQAKGHGHAGTAMGLAPLMHVLFQDVMRHNPNDPEWEGRDRFVLSAGHASLALYMQLYLNGYGLELDEIANARAFGTRTPGHPEMDVTPGVEVSTGPLGQGLAAAVGMAGSLVRKRALLDNSDLFDQQVWVVAGDGCLQEGVASEASSLAGTLALSNLIVIWDDNKITIDGDTDDTFREDTRARYRSYGWDVLEIDDPEDLDGIRDVLEKAAAATRPVMIAYQSVIGWPSPSRSGTSAAHAGAFGVEDVQETKSKLGFDAEAVLADLAPDEVLDYCRQVGARGQEQQDVWQQDLTNALDANADFSAQYKSLHAHGEHRKASLAKLDAVEQTVVGKAMATRVANGEVIAALFDTVPLWGGSADLSGSTSVVVPGEAFSAENPLGTFWNFGVREHAMTAILNGIAIEGTWRPYGSTYMAFSDYLRPALRIGSLMELPTILVLTHDSVAVGEDGPTHQPVEQVSGLRSVPGVDLARPADAAEVVGVWKRTVANPQGPLALALSRQNLPALDSLSSVDGAQRGGYVVWQSGNGMDVALISAGSEVSLALSVARELESEGVHARVVSIPVTTWFDAEDKEYRDKVLPPAIRNRVAIEAGAPDGWWKYVGLDGEVLGINTFGVSGPGSDVLARKGITSEELRRAVDATLAKNRH